MRFFCPIIKVFTIVLTFLLFVTCNEKNAIHNNKILIITDTLVSRLQEKVKEIQSSKDSLYSVDSNFYYNLLPQIYSEKNIHWFDQYGISPKAYNLIANVEELIYDGIDTGKYDLYTIKNRMSKIQYSAIEECIQLEINLTKLLYQSTNDLLLGSKGNTNKEIKSNNDTLAHPLEVFSLSVGQLDFKVVYQYLRPKTKWYTIFRNEYINRKHRSELFNYMFSHHISTANVTDSSHEISILRKRLFAQLHLPLDTISRVFDSDLSSTIKLFQYVNAIKETGVVDTTTLNVLNTSNDYYLKKLALNMERLRWLQREQSQPYVWVCIPYMQLQYIENDSTAFSMRVVVGRPSRPTPAIDCKLQNIVFSPPWIVPPTIMREEVVPGIARRGGAYLSRRGLRAYDSRGRVVSASVINSSNFRKFSIGQSPGYNSSLGEIKFNMPNAWSIYMHDTPHREDFVKNYRALSSGCVRVHKPKEFAAFLLKNESQFSYNQIDSICKLRKTIFQPMPYELNVHFVYLTNAIDSAGNLMYLKDIYKWDL